MFNQTELAVLKNFASINNSQVIFPDGFKVRNNAKSVVAYYDFDKEYDFEPFGIYEIGELLSALQAFDSPTLEVKEKYILIKSGTEQIKYFTSPLEVIPEVPDVTKKFAKIDCEMKFDLPADKLAMIFKMANVLKTSFVFIESDVKGIRLVVADKLESSNNMYEVILKDTDHNELAAGEGFQIPLVDMNFTGGDYSVSLSRKNISKWANHSGVSYFVGCQSI